VRRLLIVGLVAAAAAAVAFALPARGDGEGGGKRYTVELDNAFGLVQGADLKIAGVRAGKISGMRVDRRSHRALIDFEITENGFGSLRTDVTCETRPQSLIGEYFLDCKPGTAPTALREGATIPVERTTSTIPVDLVNNILQRPYRERLRIILDELGVGVAGRSGEIDETIRRASPALRETDRVLKKLGDQNRVLTELVADADTVIGDLADNRHDVGRWVTETREAAAASAERRDAIAGSLRRLPTFLRELKPTMAALGGAAEAQTPALRNLNASAGQLTRLLEGLAPFADASKENFTSLAEAARAGRPAVRAATPVVAELNRATQKLPELSGNSAIVLEHLDDRRNAVEKDPRSPGGQGYTGFESLLNYFHNQALAINTYDRNGYILKINLFVSKCSEYQNLKSLKEHMKKDPGFFADCAAVLGPNLPGITAPDPTATGKQFAEERTQQPASRRDRRDRRDRGDDRREGDRRESPAAEPPAAQTPAERRQERRDAIREREQALRDLVERLEDQLGIDLPDVPALPETPGAPLPEVPPLPQLPVGPDQLPNAGQAAPPQTEPLLDFLFGQ
jgi:virulence factor Mce-like protein